MTKRISTMMVQWIFVVVLSRKKPKIRQVFDKNFVFQNELLIVEKLLTFLLQLFWPALNKANQTICKLTFLISNKFRFVLRHNRLFYPQKLPISINSRIIAVYLFDIAFIILMDHKFQKKKSIKMKNLIFRQTVCSFIGICIVSVWFVV